MPEFYINDQRADGDPSLEYYPRLNTYQELQAVFGVQVSRHFGWDAAPPGALVWKLVGWNVRTGAAIFFPRVLGEDGNPYYNAPTNSTAVVFHTWAGAPEFPVPDTLRPEYNTILAALTGEGFTVHHALYSISKVENGDADFAYGGGMMGGPSGGPGAIWVSAAPPQIPDTEQAQYSDCAYKLGWIGGTDHLTASPVFQLTRKEGSTPPPTSGDEYLVKMDALGNVTGYLRFTPGSPSVPAGGDGEGYLGLMRGDQVVGYLPWAPGQPAVAQGVFAQIARFLRAS